MRVVYDYSTQQSIDRLAALRLCYTQTYDGRREQGNTKVGGIYCFEQVGLRFTHIDGELEIIKGKIDGTNRRIDAEVENRAQIETRVRKLAEVVFHS